MMLKGGRFARYSIERIAFVLTSGWKREENFKLHHKKSWDKLKSLFNENREDFQQNGTTSKWYWNTECFRTKIL